MIKKRPGWMWEAHGHAGVLTALRDADDIDRMRRQERRQDAVRSFVTWIVSFGLGAVVVFCRPYARALLHHPGAIILAMCVAAIVWCALPRNYE